MRRRIFIAINSPESIKKRLGDFREKWEGLPVRWTKKDSLHLTLVFIGYVVDNEVYEVCKLVRGIAQKHEQFSLEFEKILYGPPGKAPRMIWLKGRQSAKLSQVKDELENVLADFEGLSNFRVDGRSISSHITLARIKMGQRHDSDRLPKIEQEFRVSLPVATIDVMESDLKRDGAEYTVLESCPLGR